MTVARKPKPKQETADETAPRIARIANEKGEVMNVPLEFDGQRESATLTVDGIRYYFERMPREELMANYKVDLDPDYEPQSDKNGYCYILVPFSR